MSFVKIISHKITNKKVGHIIYVFLHGDVSNIILHKRKIFPGGKDQSVKRGNAYPAVGCKYPEYCVKEI